MGWDRWGWYVEKHRWRKKERVETKSKCGKGGEFIQGKSGSRQAEGKRSGKKHTRREWRVKEGGMRAGRNKWAGRVGGRDRERGERGAVDRDVRE